MERIDIHTAGSKGLKVSKILFHEGLRRFYATLWSVRFEGQIRRSTLEIEILRRVSTKLNFANSGLTSYSTPAKQSLLLAFAISVAFFKTPRGSTHNGAFVSGSKNETKKKGTLFSQGTRLYDERSIVARMSR
jgi:hypothetical protein